MLNLEEKKNIADKVICVLELGAVLTLNDENVNAVILEALKEYKAKLEDSIEHIKSWKEIIKQDIEWSKTHETAADHR